MNPRINQILLSSFPSILTVIISIIRIPGYFCQPDQTYETCSQQRFDCGYLEGLGYPFWGGDRLESCGHPAFQLTGCGNDVPSINISSDRYRVLDIDNAMQTLRIARQDLWDNLCPILLHNTTLDYSFFDYYPSSGDQNITLYYGCSVSPNASLPFVFDCNVNGTLTSSFYTMTGVEPPGPGTSTRCNSSIIVPVNQTAAKILATPTISNGGVLQAALANGFTVQWSADDRNCQNCMRSNGACGYSPDSESFACYCSDRPHAFTCNNTQFGDGSNGKRTSGIRISIVGGAVILLAAVILLVLLIFLCKRMKKQENNQNVEEFLINQGSLAPTRYTYSEIKKMTKSFACKLGQGGYGTVYKGTLPDGRPVAVKLLIDTDSNGEEFINEVASISRTAHINIVNLFGFCYDRNKRALIYEYMPNRSLDDFIRTRTGTLVNADDHHHLRWDKLYKIAVGVARGLEYLHRGCNTRIVHFDIKPQNILLDEDFCPKISDFGLAKLCQKKQSILSMTGTRGTVGYIAPEVFLRSFGGVSHKSDVYSYGMMVLEMVGARKNRGITIQSESSENYFPDKIYDELLKIHGDGGLDGLSIDEEEGIAIRKMYLVGFWCIQTNPSDRPAMTKVVEMLEGSLQSIQIPPKPILCAPVQEFASSVISIDVESSVNPSEGPSP